MVSYRERRCVSLRRAIYCATVERCLAAAPEGLMGHNELETEHRRNTDGKPFRDLQTVTSSKLLSIQTYCAAEGGAGPE